MSSIYGAHGVWTPGVLLMRNLDFRAKALLISLASLIPMVCLIGLLLNSKTDDSLKDRMAATRQHVEIAHGVLVWAQAKEASGEMKHEQAQSYAKQAIAAMRYDKDEYFWINDMTPTVVMHPIKPELNGQDVSALKDANGYPLFIGFVDKVRKDSEGFVSYLWTKPGMTDPVEKVSYVKGFTPWGWVVGSGIYIDDLRAEQRNRIQLVGSVLAAVVLLAAYVFICFYKVNQGGLALVSRHLNELASGDLSKRPGTPWGKDEPALLILDLHKVYDSILDLIQRMDHASRELASTSAEVSRASLDLSRRTEDAASNLGIQASAVQQINDQINQSAQHTQQAAVMAGGNAEVAEQGGKIIGNVVDTMEGIRTSSSRISEIIGTIDGIAFQTNILALNAAVEAARAGESGRGFAVVASEVRSLAGRSAAAAREIKTLISDSQEKVIQGAHVVEDAGRNISEIVANAKQINSFLDEISRATHDQSGEVAQVVNAIRQLDDSTQQNAALVEQTSASAESLNAQATELTREIARFRLH